MDSEQEEIKWMSRTTTNGPSQVFLQCITINFLLAGVVSIIIIIIHYYLLPSSPHKLQQNFNC